MALCPLSSPLHPCHLRKEGSAWEITLVTDASLGLSGKRSPVSQRARIPSGTHCCVPTTQTGPSNKARWPGRWNGWTLKVCCL